MAQPLAQLADVALDDVLVDVLAEETIDVVEDLRLGHPAALVVDEILENAPLAAGQGQHLAGDLGVATVVEHAHVADDGSLRLRLHPAADGLDAGQDLAYVHGLA